MSFVWDERKERKNIRKHKVSFDEAITTFDDPFFVIAADDYHSLEEKRFIILGKSNAGRLLVVAYADRRKDTRIISAREATGRESVRTMKKKSNNEMDDDLLPEYDFSKMRIVARGPKRKAPKAKVIHLEPDVAKAFPNDASVNEALRMLIRIARDQSNQGQSKRRAG